jgi:hypothetical protein
VSAGAAAQSKSHRQPSKAAFPESADGDHHGEHAQHTAWKSHGSSRRVCGTTGPDDGNMFASSIIARVANVSVTTAPPVAGYHAGMAPVFRLLS